MPGWDRSMYGTHDFPLRFDNDGLLIEFFDEGEGLFQYHRELWGETVRKRVYGPGKVIINPVEPCNLPKRVTRFLEIHFPALVIGPETHKKVYLTFPTEIGVFVREKGDFEVLDVFSFVPQKYSLYGPFEGGMLTRWYESQVFPVMPPVDHTSEGVLELTIRNGTRSFVEVSRVIFDSVHMYVYYGRLVSMCGVMNIISSRLAETSMKDRPVEPGMHNSIPVFSAKKLLMVEVEKPVLLMEHGFGDGT